MRAYISAKAELFPKVSIDRQEWSPSNSCWLDRPPIEAKLNVPRFREVVTYRIVNLTVDTEFRSYIVRIPEIEGVTIIVNSLDG